MLLHRITDEEQAALMKEGKQIERILERAPEGRLVSMVDRGYFKYYKEIRIRGKKKRIYIPKKDRELAVKLAWKEYYERRSRDIQDELNAIRQYKKFFFSDHRDGRYYLKTRTQRFVEDRRLYTPSGFYDPSSRNRRGHPLGTFGDDG